MTQNDRMMENELERIFGKKRPWPIKSVLLEVQDKTTKISG
jgi:hypothetical protein